MGGILLQKLLYLDETMLFGQLYRQIPLVEEDTTVDGFLGITELYIGIHSLFAKSH